MEAMKNHFQDDEEAMGIPRPRKVINSFSQTAKLVTIDIHRGRQKSEKNNQKVKIVSKNGANNIYETD